MTQESRLLTEEEKLAEKIILDQHHKDFMNNYYQVFGSRQDKWDRLNYLYNSFDRGVSEIGKTNLPNWKGLRS